MRQKDLPGRKEGDGVKTSLPYAEALKIAAGVVEDLTPCCERIEIAGSLRRKKPEVGDIEIVCIAKFTPAGFDLLGEPCPGRSLLEEYVGSYQLGLNGPWQKKLILASIDVDLFITTPEKWGVIYTIRTGSSDFSKWLVTDRQHGGALPSHLVVKDGRLRFRYGGKEIDTPEETDFFKAINLRWIHPEQRTEGKWRR